MNYIQKEKIYQFFITGISCMINDKEVSPAEAYKIFCMNDLCRYKRKNIFNLKRTGCCFGKNYMNIP